MVTQDPDLQFMNVDDISLTLKLNKSTIQRWIREGIIPAKRIGKEYRITKLDFIGWYNNYKSPNLP